MNKKEIIILAAIGAGVYILSQVKAMKTYIAPQHAKTAAEKIAEKIAQKVAPKRIGQPTTQAAYIAAAQKAAAQKKIRQEAAQKIAQRIAQKVAQKVAPKKIGQPTTWLAHIAALRKAAQRKAAIRKAAQRKAAIRKAAAQKIGKKIGKTVAQSMAQKIKTLRAARARYAKRQRPQIQRPNPNKKQVVSWKAPYRFPNKKFRVITPSDLLKNLAKKDIARKKAEQQKTAQKTTPSTPSDRRKKRLKALYGSHWHDIWVQRQRR